MTKSKQISFYILFVVLSINLVVGYSVFSSSKTSQENDQVESVRVFVDAVKLLRNNYVDEDKVAYQKLVYAAIDGMVKELDKHSRFHSPVENQEVKEDSNGKFAGIGVTMQFLDKKLIVNKIIPNGPASKSDLRSQDVIVGVDGISIVGEGMDRARELIKGEKGSEVVLKVYRESVDAEVEIAMIRDIVTVPSITRVHKLSQGKIGYIYIDQFNRTTDTDFEANVRKFKDEGVNGLIIDLRGNPGGMLDTAINMCSLFVDEDELVLYTQGRENKSRQEYFARGGSKFMDMPIVILINEGSASASEILSACLRDYDRAVLVGAKTYGKGSVQTIVDLRDGSALRFTIAKYYTKSGRTIHNVGIDPDLKVPLNKDEQKDLNKVLRDLFPTAQEISAYDKDDKQLKAAVSVMNEILEKRSPNESITDFYKKHSDSFQKDYLPEPNPSTP
ncbi:MAG: S41 family peptidase [Lentisphaeraceae bacterium]|nr:S41 family peptidase [Lentisphaeraceae bacterium]